MYTGTGSQTVPVDPVPSLMVAAITVSGSGPVTVQPVHASAPVGPPIVGTAPLEGRYLIGSAGLFSSLAVTATGDWTIRIQRPSSAIVLGPGAPASGVQPDVVSYTEAVPTALVLDAPTAAAITVSALSAAGPVSVLEQPGPYSGPITVPDGSWLPRRRHRRALDDQRGGRDLHHHLIAMTILDEDYGCPSA